MNPRLVALTGPLKGRVITLMAETSIGRGSSNHIAVSDPSLSRKHCLISRVEAGFTLTDLGSSNGAYVNGVPVQERLLEHGDQITLGDSVFLFLLREGEPPAPSNPVRLSDDDLLKGLTVRLRRENAVYLTRAARDLNTPPYPPWLRSRSRSCAASNGWNMRTAGCAKSLISGTT